MSGLDQLKAKFSSAYGLEPCYVIRAPGRVNLIGEHVDYSGYGVLPMALEQSITALIAPIPQPLLKLTNHHSSYPSFEVATGIPDIKFEGKPEWYHYFLCGYRGMLEHLKKIGSGDLNLDKGLAVLVEGTVPPSAGLSSSSALVCCAALSTLVSLSDGKSFDLVSRSDMADLCASCERYIGTQGGGMDQAVCFLAEPNQAKLIEFNPLRTEPVLLPQGLRFVVANCCVEMNKAATSYFNERVVECRLAAQVLVSLEGKNWDKVKRLKDAQDVLGHTLAEMGKVTESRLKAQPYTAEEICAILHLSLDQMNTNCLTKNTEHMLEFRLRDRALHCYTEANRVFEFRDACLAYGEGLLSASEALQLLGALMNASHDSCRDQYQCSCAELDTLVEISRNSGAAGSRLTGAGWGGCSVSLVAANQVEQFKASLAERYYGARALDPKQIFDTAPEGGATVNKV